MASETLTDAEIQRRIDLAVIKYNRANPDQPITAGEIKGKSRGGLYGKIRLFLEGAYDALTDQVPEDFARFLRNGAREDGWQSRMIERQKKDRQRRLPSLEEAIGDEEAINAYSALGDIPSNALAGAPGFLGGLAAAGPYGGIMGGMGTVAGAYGRIARDRATEELRERFRAERGRYPDSVEDEYLLKGAGADIDAYVKSQALKEGIGQGIGTLIAGPVLSRIGGPLIRAGLGRALSQSVANSTAGSCLARLGRFITDAGVGEAFSPDRSFDGDKVYKGLDFTGLNKPAYMKDYFNNMDKGGEVLQGRNLGATDTYLRKGN